MLGVNFRLRTPQNDENQFEKQQPDLYVFVASSFWKWICENTNVDRERLDKVSLTMTPHKDLGVYHNLSEWDVRAVAVVFVLWNCRSK